MGFPVVIAISSGVLGLMGDGASVLGAVVLGGPLALYIIYLNLRIEGLKERVERNDG